MSDEAATSNRVFFCIRNYQLYFQKITVGLMCVFSLPSSSWLHYSGNYQVKPFLTFSIGYLKISKQNLISTHLLSLRSLNTCWLFISDVFTALYLVCWFINKMNVWPLSDSYNTSLKKACIPKQATLNKRGLTKLRFASTS